MIKIKIITIFLLLAFTLQAQVYRDELADSTAAIRSDFPAGGSSDTTHFTTIPKVFGLQDSLNSKQNILSEGAFVDGDKTKLNGIETGAEVNEVTLTGSETLTHKTLTSPTLTSPVLNANISGTGVLDEDDMVSNNNKAVATQQSIKAYSDSLAMIGSANAQWITCTFVGHNAFNDMPYRVGAYLISNEGTTDMKLTWMLTIPTTKYGRSLYIDGIEIYLYAADANDYINRVRVWGHTSSQTFYDDGTNQTSGAYLNDGDEMAAWGSADNASAAYYVIVYVECSNTDANGLYIGYTKLHCYYE